MGCHWLLPCPPATDVPINTRALPLPHSCAVGCQFFLCWLLYFYTASAMRESVLKVNGSHIRPWCAQPVTGTSCQVPASQWPLGEAGLAAWAHAESKECKRRSRRATPENTATGLTRRLIRRPALPPPSPYSNRRRWIHHHYWSIGTAMLMLSLPVDSPSVARSVQTFLWWAILQGAVIVMQNR